MDAFTKAIQEVKKDTSARKFTQSIDVIFTLKDLDLKKPEDQIDFYFKLPSGLSKKKKICALVGPEMVDDSQKVFDRTIIQAEFEKFSKKDVKKLAEQFDYFVAQVNIMPKVAAVFGRVLGPRNKMPNPKAGQVVAPKANLTILRENLKDTVRLKAKGAQVIQSVIGTVDMSDEKLAENLKAAYDAMIHHLPKEHNNFSAMHVKLTMGKPIKVL